MKNPSYYLLFLLLLVLAQNVRMQTTKLQVLYQSKQFFDLRDEVLKQRSDNSSDVLFYRGAVANKFNQIDTSIATLQNFLKRFKDDSLRRDALELLADDYVKIYQYAKAADAYKKLLENYGADELGAEKSGDVANSYRLFDAARRIPPQTISFRKNTIIQGMRDAAGLFNIPVEANNQNADFVLTPERIFRPLR